jgi:hypothetical protein
LQSAGLLSDQQILFHDQLETLPASDFLFVKMPTNPAMIFSFSDFFFDLDFLRIISSPWLA